MKIIIKFRINKKHPSLENNIIKLQIIIKQKNKNQKNKNNNNNKNETA